MTGRRTADRASVRVPSAGRATTSARDRDAINCTRNRPAGRSVERPRGSTALAGLIGDHAAPLRTAALLRRPRVDFDVGSPRIGNERDADAAVIYRVGPVKLDVVGLKRLDEG